MEELARLENEPRLTTLVKDQIQKLEVELRFLKMFFWCLPKLEEAGKDAHLQSAIISINSALRIAQRDLYSAGLDAIRKKMGRKWRLLIFNLLEKVEQFKSEIRKNCNFLFKYCSLESIESCTAEEIIDFLDCISMNIKNLAYLKDEMVAPMDDKIGSLEEKLKLFKKFIEFTSTRCTEHQKLEDFLALVHSWAYKVACLSFLYWVHQMNEDMVHRLNIIFSDMQEKIKPRTPGVTGKYLGVLKASKTSASDTFLKGEIVENFVGFLLENLVVPLKDHIEVIQEGLIITITFLMDSPGGHRDDKKHILTQADAVVNDAVSLFCSFSVEEMNEDIIKETNFLLSDVQKQIHAFKDEVRELYVEIPDSSEFCFLRTHGMEFFNFTLGNIKKMLKHKASFIPFVKHKVLTVHRELESLRPFLKDIMEGQNKHEELRHLWTRIINVAYHAEHVIDLCSIIISPLWYNVICISMVIEEIKITKTEVENCQDKHTNNTGTAEMNSMHPSPEQATTSTIDEVVVGFDDEVEAIIDRLTRGSAQLEIVSIVGMPGQGKTTLAKKVYNHPSIQYHFIKCAWCFVSQEYRYRNLLLEILSNIIELTKHETFEMNDEELAIRLRKSLMGRSYLIILDDIWDTGAWNDLKNSFPDNNNGSRVLFTSRIQHLSWQVERKCYFHHLRPFYEEESWELLKGKIFQKDDCPQDLLPVGMQIARRCKGLPLSIVLVAGLLARSKNSLDWWEQIAESLSSYLNSEGCMDILELSYKHLPDYLKPCFLYFGAFADHKVTARKLSLLWIAEGFIQRTEMERLEDIAMEYLMDLVNQSLVIVNKRSSEGGIKECHVHDLLRVFCVTKSREENFLQLIQPYDPFYYPFNALDVDTYRLCVHSTLGGISDSNPICSPVNTILVFRRAKFINSCIFQIFRLLKVLDMESFYWKSLDLEKITLIVHLRYLAISGGFTRIPSSIVNLWNLETLIVKGVMFSTLILPDTIWQMKSLRHVNVGDIAFIPLGAYELELSCRLENVRTFSSAFLRLGRDTETLLRRLPRLRKLSCTISESNHRGKRCKFPRLSSLSELEVLNVINDVTLFKCPFSTAIPGFEFPKVLRKLTLSEFCLPRSAISTIGRLPNLLVLKLRSIAFVKQIMYVEDEGFLSLKFLEIWGSELKEWIVPSEPFPSLQQLVLTNCTNLDGIPSSFADISTLKMIKLNSCCSKVEKSAWKIFEDLQDMGINDLQLVCS